MLRDGGVDLYGDSPRVMRRRGRRGSPETRDRVRDGAVLPVLHPEGDHAFELGSRDQRSDLGSLRFDANSYQCLIGRGNMEKLELIRGRVDHGDEDRSPVHGDQAHDIVDGFLGSRHDDRHVLGPPVGAEVIASFPRPQKFRDALSSFRPDNTSWHVYYLHLVRNFPSDPISHGARIAKPSFQRGFAMLHSVYEILRESGKTGFPFLGAAPSPTAVSAAQRSSNMIIGANFSGFEEKTRRTS